LNGLTYGGTLNLSFTSSLTNGDLLDLFSFTGASSGNFTSVVSTGNYDGAWTSDDGVWTFNGSDQLLTFDLSSGDLSFAGSSIPEPSTFALIGGAMIFGAAASRRLRRRE